MSRRIVLCMCCAALAFSLPAAAEESAEEVSRRYHEAGVADAEAMARKFEETVKPRYQRAYDNYLADLEIIKVTGRANDDENLYDDLRKMNSNEFFVYSQSERGINLNRGNAFR